MCQLNPQLSEMVGRRRLNSVKIEALGQLKEFVDRLAREPYTSEEKAQELFVKYGVYPDIISWGDYFQVQLARLHWEKEDEEFLRFCRTIMYDLMEAALIFTGKDNAYRQEIKDLYFIELGKEAQKRDNTILRLAQLCFYFEELGLDKSELSPAELRWFAEQELKAVV
ncbi:MAG: hypothetical protein NZM25_03810 [Leptospiraceae bacterium]|nr:hypothetical protein [Leptospiraceae bacterium]MDW8306111.1 hypothetical protein [Leptospiraceae bacterium]